MSDTPTSSTTPKTSTSTTSTEPTSTQYVAAAVDDDRLEPDAMRGSEQYLKNVKGLDNLDQKRTDTLQAQQQKPA